MIPLLLSACVLPEPAVDTGAPVLVPNPERHVEDLALLPAGTSLEDAADHTERFRRWTKKKASKHHSSGSVGKRRPPKSTQSAGHFEVRMPSGAPLSTPVVHEEVVLSSGGFHGEQVYAYAHGSGEPMWGLDLSDDGPSTAACEDGICVFNTESCTVFAVDVLSGELRWSYYLGDPQMSAPSVSRGIVYTSYPVWGHGDASHVLAAFDLQSGALRWQTWLDADVMSAPVVADGELFLTTFAGTVVRLDPDTGYVRGAWGARATSAPVVLGDAVWFSRRVDTPSGVMEALAGAGAMGVDQHLGTKAAPWLDARVQQRSDMWAEGMALDAGNGFGGGAPIEAGADKAMALIGQTSVSTLQAYQGSRPLPWNGLQISTMGDEVLAVDITTGAPRWRHALEGDVMRAGGALGTPPLAAGGNVLVGTLTGEIHLLDPVDGRLRKTYTIGHPVRSQPVVHDGWIYVGTTDGRLIGIDTGDPEITGWEQWGRDGARTGTPG
ncbi:MAG: PQQ-binding-like beta-propeller repeat protein [Alphaproteobacteria bacterium]|nr:PQQ-binding-like beta-propeller repeat protein [Alphaproteobacteria bacterium]